MQDRDRQAAIRLSALRAALKSSGLNGFIVPKADEFQNEYVPAYADRLAWLTGFTGSAGHAVILEDKAALIVDSRYTLQAKAEVSEGLYAVELFPKTKVSSLARRQHREGRGHRLRSGAAHARGPEAAPGGSRAEGLQTAALQAQSRGWHLEGPPRRRARADLPA